MPAENQNNMMGDYTRAELDTMNDADFLTARACGFRKPSGAAVPTHVEASFPKIESMHTVLDDPTPTPPSLPQSTSTPEDTAQAWASGGGYEYTTNLGHKIRMRDLPIEEAAAAGLLDRITQLQSITQDLINKSEGAPPQPASIKTGIESIKTVTEVVNAILPMVVVEPKLYAIPDPNDPDETQRERVVGRIYVDSVPLAERMDIFTHAVEGLSAFRRFRG
jgi:hypothetical protein